MELHFGRLWPPTSWHQRKQAVSDASGSKGVHKGPDFDGSGRLMS